MIKVFEIGSTNGDFFGYTTGDNEDDVYSDLINDADYGMMGDTLSVCEIDQSEVKERIFFNDDKELIDLVEEDDYYKPLVLTHKYNKAKTEFNMSESHKRRNDLYKYMTRLGKELKKYEGKNN